MTNAETIKTLKRLKLLARFMDNGWAIPFTRVRFGADAVIGLLPVGGDLITLLPSIYILIKAHEMGAPKHLLVKMAGNIAIDTGLGAIPVLGDVFDVLFKSNIRNIDLLTDYINKNTRVSS